jgi:hypothetical protein
MERITLETPTKREFEVLVEYEAWGNWSNQSPDPQDWDHGLEITEITLENGLDVKEALYSNLYEDYQTQLEAIIIGGL